MSLLNNSVAFTKRRQKKRSTLTRYSQVEQVNPSFDNKITSISNYIENKLCNGLYVQDIVLPVSKAEYTVLIRYAFAKRDRTVSDLILIKHYLSSFTKYQSNSRNYFDDPNAEINKMALCMRIEIIPANTIVCVYGNVGDKFYIIFKGEIAVVAPVKYDISLTEEEFFSHLNTLYKLNEYELLMKTIALNRHVLLPAAMKEKFSVKMNINGDECTCQDNFACEHRVSVDTYIKRVQPQIRSDDYCSNRVQVTLLLYKLLCVMKEGDTFGDVALNRAENKRTASIITTTSDCTFGTITKEEYDYYIKESQDKLNKTYMDTIFSISLFKEVSYDFFAKTFLPLFKPEVYYGNQFLFKQHTPRNAIYILHSGQIEISLKSNIKDINNIIASMNASSSSSVVNDYELLKKYGTHITQSANMKEFYKEMQELKVLLVNKSDIIGLDEYLKVNTEMFQYSAKVVSLKCTVLVFNMNQYDVVFGYKKIQEKLQDEIRMRKEVMRERIVNVKETKLVQYCKGLKEDTDKMINYNERSLYMKRGFKNNFKLIKNMQNMHVSSHLYSVSECNSNCTNSISNANTNGNGDHSGQGSMMLKYKMQQKGQTKGKVGINSLSNNISYSNSGYSGSNANIKLTPLKYNGNVYSKVNSQRNKHCNAIYKFNLCCDNSNSSGNKEKKVRSHLHLLTLQSPVCSTEKKVSPFYDNMFSSTRSGRNKYCNEKAILKEIQMSTEINNKLLSLSKHNNNNSNNCKSNLPYSKLDFMAFDKYIEHNLQSRNHKHKLHQCNISTKYKTNIYNRSAIFVKIKKANNITTINDINMNNNI